MFSVSNVTQLIKIELILNRKLLLWLTAVFGVLFLLTAKTVPQVSALYHIALFVGGALISSAAFKEIHDKNTAMLYMTLPVSAAERYLSIWLLTGPFYLIFITALYALGMMVSIFQGSFFNIELFSFSHMAINYLIFNALFLWGSIYFEKLALIKTIGSLLALGLMLAIIKAMIFPGAWILFISNQLSQIIWLGLGIVAFISAYYQLKNCEIK